MTGRGEAIRSVDNNGAFDYAAGHARLHEWLIVEWGGRSLFRAPRMRATSAHRGMTEPHLTEPMGRESPRHRDPGAPLLSYPEGVITRAALLLFLSGLFGCQPSPYTYSFWTKGGAQRFPKNPQSRSGDRTQADGGAVPGPTKTSARAVPQ